MQCIARAWTAGESPRSVWCGHAEGGATRVLSRRAWAEPAKRAAMRVRTAIAIGSFRAMPTDSAGPRPTSRDYPVFWTVVREVSTRLCSSGLASAEIDRVGHRGAGPAEREAAGGREPRVAVARVEDVGPVRRAVHPADEDLPGGALVARAGGD